MAQVERLNVGGRAQLRVVLPIVFAAQPAAAGREASETTVKRARRSDYSIIY